MSHSPHRAPVIANIGHILLRLQTEWYHNLVPTNNDYHCYFLLIYMYIFHMVTLVENKSEQKAKIIPDLTS